MKEQEKNPEKKKLMKQKKFICKEFKALIIRMLTGIRKKNRRTQNFNRDLESIKKKTNQ